MSGYVAIPNAAFVAAETVGPLGELYVVRLYRRADLVRFGWVTFTDASLAGAWGCSEGKVRQLLAALKAAGCVVLERSAPRSKEPSRMRVIHGAKHVCPDGEAEREADGEAEDNAANADESADAKQTGKQSGKHRARVNAHARADQTRPDEEQQTPLTPRGGGDLRIEWVAAVGLADLNDLAARGRDLQGALARFRAGDAATVDRYVAAHEPVRRKVAGLGGVREVIDRSRPGQPDGLRRRDWTAGLQLAAARWRPPAAEPLEDSTAPWDTS